MKPYMFASDGSKRDWSGDRWTPVYLDDGFPIHVKVLNNRKVSYHWDERYCKAKDFVSDY